MSDTKSTITATTSPIQILYETEFDTKLCVLVLDHKKWYIGVEIANLLQRETYNLYRSMKVKNIPVRRATPEQVDFLLKINIVKPGTRSITLIPAEQALAFVSEELKKTSTKKKPECNELESLPTTSTLNPSTEPIKINIPVRKLSLPSSMSEITPAPRLSSSALDLTSSAFEALCEVAEDEYTHETCDEMMIDSVDGDDEATYEQSGLVDIKYSPVVKQRLPTLNEIMQPDFFKSFNNKKTSQMLPNFDRNYQFQRNSSASLSTPQRSSGCFSGSAPVCQ
eukprot:TRINITY_DN7361_c0_g1_i1.p1 TRINITY_DN7361_c0_g1~~TRINITY_DN7361_c0_g1_i1.p1  ORF type:complete len:281 (-),score=43.88 TRINITY_DN7361_c0_g1_i1:63-905(-)